MTVMPHLPGPVLPQLAINLEFGLEPVLFRVTADKTASFGQQVSGLGNQLAPFLGIDVRVRLAIYQSSHHHILPG